MTKEAQIILRDGLLVSSADNLCKQLGPRSGPPEPIQYLALFEITIFLHVRYVDKWI